jgi:hypothetical protein
VAFYIRKTLAQGPIRFGVAPRRPLESIDSDPALSTGAKGEFLRRQTRAFFFADNRTAPGAKLPVSRGISATPFWKSVYDGTQRGWIFLGSTVLGAILLLLGLAVIARKGPQGWVEVILGLAGIVTPLVMTAQTRRKTREQEERDRAAREEEERRNRAMLASYLTALDNLRASPNDVALGAAAREREALTLPYEIWCGVARSTVVSIAFDALHRLGAAGIGEVNDLITRTARAVGLSPADEMGVKVDVYRTAAWHLLADDRIAASQEASLRALRDGLELGDNDVPSELGAVDEFARLRGYSREKPPKTDCPAPLGFHEYCLHVAKGSILKRVRERVARKRIDKLVPDEPCTLIVTNRRLILDGKKRVEILLPKIDDVELDADANVLAVRAAKGIKPFDLQLEDPIYTGAVIDIATGLNERPRGLA